MNILFCSALYFQGEVTVVLTIRTTSEITNRRQKSGQWPIWGNSLRLLHPNK